MNPCVGCMCGETQGSKTPIAKREDYGQRRSLHSAGKSGQNNATRQVMRVVKPVKPACQSITRPGGTKARTSHASLISLASASLFNSRAFQVGRPWPGQRTSRMESQTQLKSPQRMRGSDRTQHGRRASKNKVHKAVMAGAYTLTTR